MPDVKITDPATGQSKTVRFSLAPGQQLKDSDIDEAFTNIFGHDPGTKPIPQYSDAMDPTQQRQMATASAAVGTSSPDSVPGPTSAGQAYAKMMGIPGVSQDVKARLAAPTAPGPSQVTSLATKPYVRPGAGRPLSQTPEIHNKALDTGINLALGAANFLPTIAGQTSGALLDSAVQPFYPDSQVGDLEDDRAKRVQDLANMLPFAPVLNRLASGAARLTEGGFLPGGFGRTGSVGDPALGAQGDEEIGQAIPDLKQSYRQDPIGSTMRDVLPFAAPFLHAGVHAVGKALSPLAVGAGLHDLSFPGHDFSGVDPQTKAYLDAQQASRDRMAQARLTDSTVPPTYPSPFQALGTPGAITGPEAGGIPGVSAFSPLPRVAPAPATPPPAPPGPSGWSKGTGDWAESPVSPPGPVVPANPLAYPIGPYDMDAGNVESTDAQGSPLPAMTPPVAPPGPRTQTAQALAQDPANTNTFPNVPVDTGGSVALSTPDLTGTAGGQDALASSPAPSVNSGFNPSRPVETTYTPGNKPIRYQWDVVPLDDLIASHNDNLGENPAYPHGPRGTGLQPRDRTGSALSYAQIQEKSQNLNPDLLGESKNAADGSPIVGPSDNLVESGNTRTLALRNARSQARFGQQWQGYQDFVEQQAAQRGLPTEGIKDPVLVRRRVDELPMDQRYDLARDLNKSSVMAQSAAEDAHGDAQRLASSGAMNDLHIESGGGLMSRGNVNFTRTFFGKGFTNEELGGLVDKNGVLTSQGEARLKNAMLAYAYGDSGGVGGDGAAGDALIRQMTTDANDGAVKNLGNAIQSTAALIAKRKYEAKQGTLKPELDPTQDIAGAVQALASIKEGKGGTVAQRARQWIAENEGAGDMFGQKASPETAALVNLFSDANEQGGKPFYSNNRRNIEDFIEEYGNLWQKAGGNQEGLSFGDESTGQGGSAASRLSLIDQANRNVHAERGRPLTENGEAAQGSLLDEGMGQGRPQFPTRGKPTGERGAANSGDALTRPVTEPTRLSSRVDQYKDVTRRIQQAQTPQDLMGEGGQTLHEQQAALRDSINAEDPSALRAAHLDLAREGEGAVPGTKPATPEQIAKPGTEAAISHPVEAREQIYEKAREEGGANAGMNAADALLEKWRKNSKKRAIDGDDC